MSRTASIHSRAIAILTVAIAASAFARASGAPDSPVGPGDAIRFPASADSGLTSPARIELRVSRTSALAPERLQDQWRRVSARPDHPDRARLEYLVGIAQSPETYSLLLGFDPESNAWIRQERRALPDRELHIHAGGRDDTRWLSASFPTPTLTAIRSGVPFPPGHNVGRLYDRAAEELRLVASRGLSALGTSYEIKTFTIASNGFRAVLENEAHVRWRAEGVIDEGTGLAMIRSLAADEPSERSGIKEAVRVSGMVPINGSSATLPQKVEWIDPLGVRTTFELVSVSTITRDELRALASVPKALDGTIVNDFRGGYDKEQYEGTPSVWALDPHDRLVALPRESEAGIGEGKAVAGDGDRAPSYLIALGSLALLTVVVLIWKASNKRG